MAKIREWIPHIEGRKKGYDNIGPEMYGYRVTELRSLDSYSIVAGTTGRTLLLQDNQQETRLKMIWILLVALSRSSCVACTYADLTTLC
jgi:hypothetical protein